MVVLWFDRFVRQRLRGENKVVSIESNQAENPFAATGIGEDPFGNSSNQRYVEPYLVLQLFLLKFSPTVHDTNTSDRFVKRKLQHKYLLFLF